MGRYWGVYGERTCLAASILFHDTARGRELLGMFRLELLEVLKQHADRIKRMRIPGPNGGLYLGSKAAMHAIMGFMYRKMARLMQETDVTCMYPTQDIDLVVEDDSLSAS